MKFENVCIESVEHFLPDEIVTSDEIEQRLAPVYEKLKLPFGRLEMMTGIRERKFWEPGTRPSWASAMAGAEAIKSAGINKDDVGCLIHSSVCRDFLEPATAAVVHEKLGLRDDVMLFDLSNACLGFMNAMVIVGNMIDSGLIKAGLIVGGENGRPLVETTIENILQDVNLTRKSMKKMFSSLTIGCGAAAVLLTHASISKTGHRLLGGTVKTATEHNGLCQGGANEDISSDGWKPLMSTDAESLLKAGCQLATKAWKETKETLGICEKSVKHFFCHQVGSAHRKLLFETLGIDMEKEFSTFSFLGNTGAVALPATFSIGIKERKVQKGDLIALMGVGSGLNCLMLGIEW